MRKSFLFCLVITFALVSARAKIFAQSETGTKSSLIRIDNYQILLDEGIDSVLNSMHFKRADFRLIIDTVQHSDKSNVSIQGQHGNRKGPNSIIQITNFVGTNIILSNSNTEEKGIYSVSVSGKICCLPSDRADTTFSFTRSRKYDTIYEDSINNESKSFWDSAAKPILVTLGAAAIIALFFLIRG